MKLTVKDLENKEKGSVELPAQFDEAFRDDLIRKAVIAIGSNSRQPYGSDPRAGMKHSAELSRRRRKYRGSYGHGISRVPRKILSRRGTRFNWVGAISPGTVGGRRAHPPKAEKVWDLKVNRKERRKAIRSAISATTDKELVSKRGHKIPETYPFIISDDIESKKRTSEIKKALENLGFADELARTQERKVRAGKGKTRGRRYKSRKGPLLVVSDSCELMRSARNIPGIEIVSVDRLNAGLLAPGTIAGRCTIFSKKAVEKMGKDNLYM